MSESKAELASGWSEFHCEDGMRVTVWNAAVQGIREHPPLVWARGSKVKAECVELLIGSASFPFKVKDKYEDVQEKLGATVRAKPE